MLDFSIHPIGAGVSVSKAVAEVTKLINESGLPSNLHDMGTTIEGTPEECLMLVAKCINLLSQNYDRISCSVKIDHRNGKESRLGTKAEKVSKLILAQ
jgi:uncharacterized protein (TIGR00106 family)